MTRLFFLLAMGAAISLGLGWGPMGCRHSTSDDATTVTLYTSVDEPYARPLIDEFQRQTGIRVNLITDVEASKSVGLVERLRAERDHPQADVWWGNECVLTINLADDGILTPYDSPSAADIPAAYKDADHRWAASILRVRMLISARGNTDKAQVPAPALRLSDLLKRELNGKISLARPTAGTTGSHVAALYVLWGADRARTFFRGLHENGAVLLGGNGVVAEYVARGELRAGVCDNDDAADANESIAPITAVLPDQNAGEAGTLAMPCALGMVAGCRHESAARKLIDFLLSHETEKKLLQTHFAWCSTRDTTGKGHFMDVDYHAVAKVMPAAIREATAILEGR